MDSHNEKDRLIPEAETADLARQSQFALFAHDPKNQERPSFIQHISKNEEKLIELAKDGDVDEMSKFLKETKTININCANYQGLTALHIAVMAENEDMVQLLLTQAEINVKDTLLHAVKTGNESTAQQILDFIRSKDALREFSGYLDSSEFESCVTPLILAAQLDDFVMINMLLRRGHEIEVPHKADCLCEHCKQMILDVENQSRSADRLHIYSALASPAYICSTSADPILYAFLLTKELKLCGKVDAEFKVKYVELASNVSSFAVDLIDLCRNTKEVEIVLSYSAGYRGSERKVRFPRLQLAIENHQKTFVASSKVQQYLSTVWFGEFNFWTRFNTLKKISYILQRVFMLPGISFCIIFAPKSKLAQRHMCPVSIFFNHLASYIWFVLIIFLVIAADNGRTRRGPPVTGLEIFVVLFTAGYLVQIIKQVTLLGFHRYVLDFWNLYDLVLVSIFIITFFYWLISLSDVVKMGNNDSMINQPRNFWKGNDPTLIHEGLFSLASILSAGRLLYFFHQSATLGPLQIALGKMAIQIIVFLAFAFVLIFLFATAMAKIYHHYNGMVFVDEHGQVEAQSSAFITLKRSMATYFWAQFGMSNANAPDITLANLEKNVAESEDHSFSENVGYFLYGLFHLMMGIALINTLVAILANSFQKVVDNVDVEWKFYRTNMWTYFFHEATVLASPFNLIIRPERLSKLVYFLKVCFKKVPGKRIKCNPKKLCFIEDVNPEIPDESHYNEVMATLVQRYLRENADSHEGY